MEIQKIFSNVEDPEENLYSIIMSEEELSLFSEFQKEFNSKAQKALRRRLEIKDGLEMLLEGKLKGLTPAQIENKALNASRTFNRRKVGDRDLLKQKKILLDYERKYRNPNATFMDV